MGLLSTFGAASGRAYGFTRSAIAAATDAFFNSVTLLLPGNGTNGAQNNTFLDSSSNTFSITRNGNTTQGTFSPFSQTGWSNYFNGSSDYLTTPDAAAFDFGTGDFTIEFFVYIAANSAADASGDRKATIISSLGTGSATGSGFAVYIEGNASTTGTGISFENRINSTTTYSISATTTVSQNAWNHIAVVRSGTTTTFYLNGASVGSGTLTNQSITSSQTINIGRLNVTGYLRYLNGYLSNLRVVKGTAVYTGAFTPPTAALTAITNTSLLTCQSNRFIDNSSNAFAITVNGTPSIQAFSSFAPTAAYSAATNGGSGYFDGTGDFLTAANATSLDLSTGDFTVEAFFYVTTSSGNQAIVARNNGNISTGNDAQYAIFITGGNIYVRPYSSTTDYSINLGSVPVNQWCHVALVRTGNTFYGYLNGARNVTTQTISGSLNNSTWSTYVGQYSVSSAAWPFSGYISQVRILKGTAQYTTATITVPTSPLTAITNTSLLLNFTNAGITDATAKNALETVGNAQISTAQSKFGGGSMSFNGTNSYLRSYQKQMFQFQGNFTIEVWVYMNSLKNFNVILDTRLTSSSTSGIAIGNTSAGNFYVDSGAGRLITSSSTYSANTWYYVALVRSGSTVTLYVDGTSAGTGSSSNAFTDGNGVIGTDNIVGGTSYFNGYMDDFRITVGFARTITTPTSAFALQ